MLARQRAFLHERIRTRANSHVVYPGLACFTGEEKEKEKGRNNNNKKRVRDPMAVPGVREAGWNLAQLGPVSQVRWMERWTHGRKNGDGIPVMGLTTWSNEYHHR